MRFIIKSLAIVTILGGSLVAAGLCAKYADPPPPSVIGTFPLPNDVNVPSSTVLYITRDRKWSDAEGAISIVLRNAAGEHIIGALEMHNDRTAVMLRPDSGLLPGAYLARVDIEEKEAFRWQFTIPESSVRAQEAGAAFLVIGSETHPFVDYLPEILRAEGITRFTTVDVNDLTSDILLSHRLAIVSGPITNENQVSLLES